MCDLNLQNLHEIVGGRLRLATLAPRGGEQSPLGKIVTDSRQVQPGHVFWGLPGTRFDGAQFAAEAFARGASGAVVGRYVQPAPGTWSLEVDDAALALNRLAAWHRRQFKGTVVGVTGSVGKTTTRQMIAAVLGDVRTGTASPKNYNNHVGVPLSMLAMRPQHDFAVLELAANAPGEIAALSELCQPHLGVITCIGQAHLGGFGSEAHLAQAKSELLEALPSSGWAILSGDDVWLRRLASRCQANVVWVGRSLDCNVVGTHVECAAGELSFTVEGHRMTVPVWGRHHLNSALAAVAVGRIFGLSMREIGAGLAKFEAAPMRCEITEVAGTTIINDSYNSSPTAMRAALELLRDFNAPGRRIVVCGDMRELGAAAESLHRQLGDEVVTLCGADLLLACGDHAGDVVSGACQAGMPESQVETFSRPEETLPLLGDSLVPGDVVLIKGSRSMAMERLVEALQQKAGE